MGAKQKGIINLSGKVGNQVFSITKNGNNVKNAPKTGTVAQKKKGQQPQNQRLGMLNSLAGQVSKAFQFYSYSFVPGKFFHKIKKRLCLEKSNDRIILLQSLQRTEISEVYKFLDLHPDMHIEAVQKKTALTVKLELTHHALPKVDRSNCYYIQVIVLMWNTENEVLLHEGVKTDWISFDDALPLYCDIDFKKVSKAGDYLVACRCVTGRDNKSPEDFPMQGIRIFTVDSFSKESKLLMEKRKAETERQRMAQPAKPETIAEKRVPLRRKK